MYDYKAIKPRRQKVVSCSCALHQLAYPCVDGNQLTGLLTFLRRNCNFCQLESEFLCPGRIRIGHSPSWMYNYQFLFAESLIPGFNYLVKQSS